MRPPEKEGIMRIGNRGVKVLKKHENRFIGVRVELTRKTTIDGRIIYAVVVTNMNTGFHYRLFTFDGIQKAFAVYKKAIA